MTDNDFIQYLATSYHDMIRTYIENQRAGKGSPAWIDERIIAETGAEAWHLVEAWNLVNEAEFSGENPHELKAAMKQQGPKPYPCDPKTHAFETAILKRQEEHIAF